MQNYVHVLDNESKISYGVSNVGNTTMSGGGSYVQYSVAKAWRLLKLIPCSLDIIKSMMFSFINIHLYF